MKVNQNCVLADNQWSQINEIRSTRLSRPLLISYLKGSSVISNRLRWKRSQMTKNHVCKLMGESILKNAMFVVKELIWPCCIPTLKSKTKICS